MCRQDIKEAFANQYIMKIQYENGKLILFNRTNGAVFLLEQQEYQTIVDTGNCDADLYNDIMESEIAIIEEIVLDTECDIFLLTIELSTLCNFKCRYCYQNAFEQRNNITEEILEKIYLYVENVFINDKSKKNLVVGFIGGEPMLHANTIRNVMKKIDELSVVHGRKVAYHIDTNGSIDFSDIFNSHNNIEVSVSLSLEEDHLLNRPLVGGNSFEMCIANLKKLNNFNNKLSIRYNTNHSNIGDFEKFVLYVKENLPHVYNIDALYTDNYDYNLFYNELSIEDFARWNSSEAIDILIKYGFPVTGAISSHLKLCTAYQPYSCKVYADGYISLCDGMFHRKILSIAELSENISLLSEKFKQYKSYNPTKDIECSKCNKIVQCQGKIFCRQDACVYAKRYREDLFISRYVYYCEKGLASRFVDM